MSRKTKQSLNVIPWIVAGVLGLSALAFYVKTSGVVGSGEEVRNAAGQGLTPAKTSEQTVHVVKPHSDGGKVSYSSEETAPPADQDSKVFALNEYLKQVPAIDKKAKVLAVDVKDGVAVLSMNSSFGLSYGSDDEKLILDGLATTLGNFDGVNSFRLTTGGQPIESLGHADLTEPLPVIRKGEAAKPAEESAPSRPR